MVLKKQLEIRYVPTADQVADVLTKGVSTARFFKMKNKLRVDASPFCLRGNVEVAAASEGRVSSTIADQDSNDTLAARLDQRGIVAEAFSKHEETFKEEIEKVQRWREALTKVASETILIKEIVRVISDKLTYASSCKTVEFVGMGSHIIELEKILCLESNAVQMVGIWGMGGIGETTIARRSKSAWIFNTNFNVIMRRLCHKRVLLVLDDVDDWKQLEALAREPSWFGPGSRIIMTTRDKHLLAVRGVKDIYEHAFKQNNPEIEYLELSKRLVSYITGHPLALKVLGSFLNGTSMLEWHTVQNKLAMIPDLRIHDVLKVSFDGLDDTQREVFLDIGFLMGRTKNRNNLECCGFFPDIAFAVLREKALVTIGNDRQMKVHDLLQEMGREIVRQESKDPGGRSRLWNPEDIHQNWEDKVHLHHGLLSLSNRLRYLRWDRFPLISSPSNFCAENLVELVLTRSNVKQLWTGVQLTTVPDLSNAKNVETIYLRECKSLTELPPCIQYLSKLNYINLTDCPSLRNLPDRINSRFLTEFYLGGCSNVKKFRFNKYSGEEACFEFEGYYVLLKHCKCMVKKCGVLLLYDDEDEAVLLPNKNLASDDEQDEPHPNRLKLSDVTV
eukprot:XP_025013585.1 LOW QUALITY PROTEIN: disease resistance protein RPP5-like [Ricinus communis]